jgi:hypothetical protein
MRTMMSCWIALALVGCSKPADKPADTAMEDPSRGAEDSAAAAAPAAFSLADVAGTWHVTGKVEGSGKEVKYDMVATSDRDGWSIKFPGRDPIPMRIVAVEGDSIVSEAGPFESVLRKGVQVRTNAVTRLQDGKLVGRTIAHYPVKGADSVARITFEGTR